MLRAILDVGAASKVVSLSLPVTKPHFTASLPFPSANHPLPTLTTKKTQKETIPTDPSYSPLRSLSSPLSPPPPHPFPPHMPTLSDHFLPPVPVVPSHTSALSRKLPIPFKARPEIRLKLKRKERKEKGCRVMYTLRPL